MKHRDDADRALTREDRNRIDTIRAELRTEPMDRVRAARFRRGIEERVQAPPSPWRRGGPVLAATAVAAAILWLSMPEAPGPVPAEVAATREADEEAVSLATAYADPEGFIASASPESWLPEDYLVLASVLDLDV